MPRRPKLTPELQDRIVAAVKSGMYLEPAALASGISPTTLWRWLAEGEAEAPPPDATPRERADWTTKREFREAVTRARARAEEVLVAAALSAAQGGVLVKRAVRVLPDGSESTEEQFSPPDGKVALDMLSRMFPRRWAKRGQLEVPSTDEDPGGGAAAVGGDPADFAELAQRLTERYQAASTRLPLESGGGGLVVEGEVVPDG